MKVLIVSHAFPPANIIGAVRIGKLAKYLYEAGHDVRVIAATGSNTSLALEIPSERVSYVAEWAIDAVFDKASRAVRRLWRAVPARADLPAPVAATPKAAAGRVLPGRWWRAELARHYHALMRIPDARAGWIAAATAAGYRIMRHWRPDVVVGSAPPNSGLVAAARIARVCGAPFVAELRDLWVDNPYYEDPGWRRCLDRLIERRILGQAAGLVSVTPQWSATLQHRYRQPVACILNGYVEADFPRDARRPAPAGVVSIVYTGNIYVGYRDPTPLFQAIGLLGAEREQIAVHFYGPAADEILPVAQSQGIADRIFVHAPVSYRRSLALQTSADVLLLLQWNNAKDAGNIPAKFFEYIGARRPILLLGYEGGDLAAMIRERRAGVVANDPEEISHWLRQWIALKPRGIPGPDQQACNGLTRDEQNRKYELFLSRTVVTEPGARALTAPSAPAALPP
jgi:glycosyltransferase involved in cell wall biosynthesis